jgi:signal transduction histidine kinase
MISNHIVTPIWLRSRGQGATISGDVRSVVLTSRRISIIVILTLGYLYYRISGGGAALASIGLISFAGVAQILPVMLGGIFWHRATKIGALAGLICGLVVWSYTMFLPSFGPEVLISQETIDHGLWGLQWLRPTALFGIQGLDPVVHAVLWSILLNSFAFVAGSILSRPSPLERVQAVQFISAFESGSSARGWQRGATDAEDLLSMAQRIIGAAQAQNLFRTAAQRQGKQGYLPDPTPQFLETLERGLAGSVGAATAHAMLGQMVGGSSVTVEDLMAVADETAQIMEYSNQLEAKSGELTTTARKLRDANDKLTKLSIQKDAFLSQISHELRTPMTSIRAFSEILQNPDLSDGDRPKYARIIEDETQRLTRLLDDLLDLSVLENGQVSLDLRQVRLREILDRAQASANVDEQLRIRRSAGREDISILTDPDRLTQVFINLMSNAAKYCEAQRPELTVIVTEAPAAITVDFIDNGAGVDHANQDMIFEKFARASDHSKAGGAGLGLAICREIITNLGGQISYLPGQRGAAFRVSLPRD